MTTGHALARVGLLGNPSDGYQGRVIAMTLPAFAAEVTVTPAPQWQCHGLVLFEAVVTALRDSHPALVAEPAQLTFTTTVPRQVGLAGSSAIIIAALRALGERRGHLWDLVDLARTALHVETEVLGWAAGPQDRVVQAYEGLIDMDFGEPWNAAMYERLDTSTLPPLFVAWNRSMGEPSDVAHANVRERWLAGDSAVVEAMHEFASLAVAGRHALDTGEAGTTWPSLLDRAFDLRRSIWNITSIDDALVAVGRHADAGVAFAGSGGAVVGCPRDPSRLDELATAYDAIGAGFAVVHP